MAPDGDSEGLDQLRRLLSQMAQSDRDSAAERGRRDFRRPPLATVQRLRVRVDLSEARPPIWRQLDIRSDLRLDMVHRVLQQAFDWTSSHLWRFWLGTDPFDPASQAFLCEWDLAEGEDEGGVPAADTRLDETLQEPGDSLAYLYDYGDNWELTLTLEEVLPLEAESVWAVAVDGARAAPPEDCGGLTDAEDLAEVLQDPTVFDLGELNGALQDPVVILTEYGVDRRLVELVDRLADTSVGDEMTRRAMALLDAQSPPAGDDLSPPSCRSGGSWTALGMAASP